MAKKFENAGSAKAFTNAKKVSDEKAKVITIKMIPNSKLHDYPNNREDVKDTTDLENSIREVGFIDPIEITPFGMPEGEYMIVSGHRRRRSGVNVGMESFPCIIREFSSQSQIENYVLLANSQRDSAKDPLLFCRRYKMHEEYLKSIDFEGNIHSEIAKRLGISVQHADRFRAMNKIILPVWDMVKSEIVGMSSVIPMARFSEEEQLEIYNIMQGALAENVTLTRDTVKRIIDNYRERKTVSVDNKEQTIVPAGQINESVNADSLAENTVVTKQQLLTNPSAEEKNVAEQLEGQSTFDISKSENGNVAISEKATIEADNSSSEEKQAETLIKIIDKLDSQLNKTYTFSKREEAEKGMVRMGEVFANVIEAMYDISREHELDIEFVSLMASIKDKISYLEG